MKLKLSEVLNAKEPLGVIITSPISVTVAYKLIPTIDAVEKAINDFDKVRIAKVHQYGDTKDGKTEVLPKNMKAFLDEINPLYEQEVELPDYQISLKMLAEKNIEITATDLKHIQLLINDDTN